MAWRQCARLSFFPSLYISKRKKNLIWRLVHLFNQKNKTQYMINIDQIYHTKTKFKVVIGDTLGRSRILLKWSTVLLWNSFELSCPRLYLHVLLFFSNFFILCIIIRIILNSTWKADFGYLLYVCKTSFVILMKSWIRETSFNCFIPLKVCIRTLHFQTLWL